MAAPQPQTLQAASPAFRAYTHCDYLPDCAPPFEVTERGYPKVLVGELFCRMPGLSRLCGQKSSTRSNLHIHLESAHQLNRADRPKISANKENSTIARDFYVDLMKNRTYDGKGEEKELEARANRWTGPASRRVSSSTENSATDHSVLQAFGLGPKEDEISVSGSDRVLRPKRDVKARASTDSNSMVIDLVEQEEANEHEEEEKQEDQLGDTTQSTPALTSGNGTGTVPRAASTVDDSLISYDHCSSAAVSRRSALHFEY